MPLRWMTYVEYFLQKLGDKMRIGGNKGFDGTPEEIKDICKNFGLKLEDYLEKPKHPLAIVWLIIPAVIFAAGLSSVSFIPNTLLFFLGDGIVLVWLLCAIQIKFENPFATSVVAIGGGVLVLVAGGFIQPQEVPNLIKNLKPNS
jgi:hypothetical protein